MKGKDMVERTQTNCRATATRQKNGTIYVIYKEGKFVQILALEDIEGCCVLEEFVSGARHLFAATSMRFVAFRKSRYSVRGSRATETIIH